jgi:hypothetical protein
MVELVVHPVQVNKNRNEPGQVSKAVTLRAYEVYKSLYGEQQSLIEGSCRGGFGSGELIAFLYAYGFPPNEWRARVDEALVGMKGI